MPGKDKGAIVKWSGGQLWYDTCDDAGGNSGGAFADLGYIQEATLSDQTEAEDFQDETGDTVKSVDTTRIVKITGLLMMSDKATMDLLKETVRGETFFHIYRYEGQVNGQHQEMLFGICKFKPMIELASGTKRIPFEITVLKNEAAITSLDISSVTDNHAATITVPVGEFYAIENTAV